jgi:hypothetical protein
LQDRGPGKADRTDKGDKMFNENEYKSRIKARISARNELLLEKGRLNELTYTDFCAAILMIAESLDDYIEHRIQTDKVLEGILNDIQGGIASIDESLTIQITTEDFGG